EDQGRSACLSADCPVGSRAGRRDYRSDDRSQRQGAGCARAALDPAAGCGGARRSEAVGVHADAAQRRPGAGHHDGYRAVHAQLNQPPGNYYTPVSLPAEDAVMEVSKMRQIARIVCAGLGMVALSTPAFAQAAAGAGAGGLNLIDIAQNM